MIARVFLRVSQKSHVVENFIFLPKPAAQNYISAHVQKLEFYTDILYFLLPGIHVT